MPFRTSEQAQLPHRRTHLNTHPEETAHTSLPVVEPHCFTSAFRPHPLSHSSGPASGSGRLNHASPGLKLAPLSEAASIEIRKSIGKFGRPARARGLQGPFPCSFIRSLEAEGTRAGSGFMIVYCNLPIMPASRIVTGQPFLRNPSVFTKVLQLWRRTTGECICIIFWLN